MGYVKTVKTTRARFAQLLQDTAVDPDILYFVNNSNGWDSQSLDTEGDIYLGDKLLTADTTYDLAVNYMKLFGCRISSVGVHAGSLCAFTADGKLSSFKTTASGTTVTTQWFRIGQPIFHSLDAMTAGTTSGKVVIRISAADVDIRNSMCKYNYRRFRNGSQTDLYMAVEVDAANGLYRPKKLTNTSSAYQSGAATSYADHIVTDLELTQGQFYIYLGARYSSGSTYYTAMFAASNPLYYYDGTNLIPYDAWRANTMQFNLGKALSFIDTSYGSIGSTTPVKQYEWHAALNGYNDSISQTIDFDLRLTLCASGTPFNADIWMELRYYDEDNGTWSQNALVLASTTAMLGAQKIGDTNEQFASGIFLRTHAHHEEIVTQNGTPHLFVCVQCDQQREFTVIGNTPVADKPEATKLFMRHWIPAAHYPTSSC